VTDDATIADAAGQIDALDILVNNAGISGDDKTPDQEDTGTFRRIYETNVFAVVAVTNGFLPALRRSARPRIVPGTRPISLEQPAHKVTFARGGSTIPSRDAVPSRLSVNGLALARHAPNQGPSPVEVSWLIRCRPP
jgi:NAD(P)-dependent dehydrogenase (short-subunit alcohol dehydrogenase family)